MKLKIKKLNPNAMTPKRATEGSAGYDIYACIESSVIIHPNKTALIPTGISMTIPENTAGLLYTRSGLGIKHGIHLTNGVGVIDSDYRGEVFVGLHNLSDTSYEIKPNERIAQLIITPVCYPQIEECDNLEDTDRGTGGFGSTGKL